MKEILEKYRKTNDNTILEEFRCQKNDYWDDNYWKRSELIFTLYNDFDPSDKVLIKWLIAEELEGQELEIPTETIQLCAFMLYKIMDFEDVYDLYSVKYGGGTDLECTTDIELVFGIDKELTKEYLKKVSTKKSKEVLGCIEHYESFENAKYKSRDEYIEYFESKRINMLIADFEDTKEYLSEKNNS